MAYEVEPRVLGQSVELRRSGQHPTVSLLGIPRRPLHLLESRLIRLVIRRLGLQLAIRLDLEDIRALNVPLQEMFAVVSERVVVLHDGFVLLRQTGLCYVDLSGFFLFGGDFLVVDGFGLLGWGWGLV